MRSVVITRCTTPTLSTHHRHHHHHHRFYDGFYSMYGSILWSSILHGPGHPNDQFPADACQQITVFCQVFFDLPTAANNLVLYRHSPCVPHVHDVYVGIFLITSAIVSTPHLCRSGLVCLSLGETPHVHLIIIKVYSFLNTC